MDRGTVLYSEHFFKISKSPKIFSTECTELFNIACNMKFFKLLYHKKETSKCLTFYIAFIYTLYISKYM